MPSVWGSLWNLLGDTLRHRLRFGKHPRARVSCLDRPMIRVQISLWSLAVTVEAELKYPDQIDDIVNRASTLFVTGLMAAKNQDLDISQMTFIDEKDDED